MTDIIIFLKFQSFFADVVQLNTEARRFKKPSKTFSDQYSKIGDFSKFNKTSFSEIVPLDA